MRLSIVGTTFLLLLTSCGDEETPICDPGETQACVCLGGTTGVQTCTGGGTGWSTCAGCYTPMSYYQTCVADEAPGEPCAQDPKLASCAGLCNYLNDVCFDYSCDLSTQWYNACMGSPAIPFTYMGCVEQICHYWTAKHESDTTYCY